MKKEFYVFFIVIGISIVILLPIPLLSIRLSSYDTIDEYLSFTYEPILPGTIEKFYINADEADIEIRYVDPSFNYYAQIEVNILLSGAKLAEKSYENFLYISWNKTSSPANFTCKIISDNWYDPSLWVIKDVEIDISLRKDIIFDLALKVNKGDLRIYIPFGTAIHNIAANTTDGSISYELNQCTLSGNISGNTNSGNLKLNVNDILCLRNLIWNLSTQKGKLDIEIYQYKELGSNITSTISFTGILNLTYHDTLEEVAAFFTIPNMNWEPIGQTKINFTVETLNPTGFNLRSSDFPAENNYKILFFEPFDYKMDIRNNYS